MSKPRIAYPATPKPTSGLGQYQNGNYYAHYSEYTQETPEAPVKRRVVTKSLGTTDMMLAMRLRDALYKSLRAKGATEMPTARRPPAYLSSDENRCIYGTGPYRLVVKGIYLGRFQRQSDARVVRDLHLANFKPE